MKEENQEINQNQILEFIKSERFIIIVLSLGILLLAFELMSLSVTYNNLVDLYVENCIVTSKAVGGVFFG